MNQLIAFSFPFLPTNNLATTEDSYYWQIVKCQVGQIEAGYKVGSIPLVRAKKQSIWLASREADGYTAVWHASYSACVSPEARTLGYEIEEGQIASAAYPSPKFACLNANTNTCNLANLYLAIQHSWEPHCHGFCKLKKKKSSPKTKLVKRKPVSHLTEVRIGSRRICVISQAFLRQPECCFLAEEIRMLKVKTTKSWSNYLN